MPKTTNQSLDINKKKRHKFFLNPDSDCAFTKCPKCDNKTKVRKFPLVIHIEPQQMFILNKQCKYCPYCDLIIAKQKELESLMAMGLFPSNPDIIGNKYLVMGTVDRNDWKEGSQDKLSPSDIIKRMYIFKDVWNFEVIPVGRYPADK